MIKKYFIIFLSFFILISSANASNIKTQSTSALYLIYNNDIYLYNGTLYNITPKYIVITWMNKTYTNDEINKHFGHYYKPYRDIFILGNKSYVVYNAWDGYHIGKLDIKNRTLYLDGRVLGDYHKLKSNNKEVLACFDNKEGMGAEPILIELKYNTSSNNIIWVRYCYHGFYYELSSKLEKYLFNHVNHSKNYYSYRYHYSENYCFDYNSKDKYWLIYTKGIFSVAYMQNDDRLKYVYNNISCFVKYNSSSFYDFKMFNGSLSQIVYNKYGNNFIGVGNDKLYILDDNLNTIKTINTNKCIYKAFPKVFPIDKDNVYLVYPKNIVVDTYKIEKVKVKTNFSKEEIKEYKQNNRTPPRYFTEYKEIKVGTKTVDIEGLERLNNLANIDYNYSYKIKNYSLGIEKINLKNNNIVEINTDNLNPVDVKHNNGKTFLLIGNDSSLYIFNNGKYKKIGNLNKFNNNIQNSNDNTIKKTENNKINYYLYGVVIIFIFIILGYVIWKKK
ncbi:hypothetical protein [Methanothermococcus okinawensis]|uniref:Uncharacterized protein n=1 Tax=Methanothermococcus okinawensis (strain DSM 14208 / JCM 11175 / IH1) TaxID=647113 RepID=F8AKZ2_METOI|nr:hypothetical protein [Methanothermococcus okinawensis]AEH06427.1 hypothetical protein Metok_0444 [Methanothermococcus okinawensis IH1]